MMVKQMIPFLVWLLLLSFSIAAQKIDENVTEEEQRLQEKKDIVNEVLNRRITQSIFENDFNATLLFLLTHSKTGLSDSPLGDKLREEFGITEGQEEDVRDLMDSKMQEADENFGESEEMIRDGLMSRVANGNTYLTKEEDEQVGVIANQVFETMESVAAEIYTEEQREKADGMILALTGGLESPFFSERHMSALEMTEKQKKEFAAINEELKPERDKMIAEFFHKVIGNIEKKGDNLTFRELIDTLSTFKSYGREIKKRRSEVLTSEQIAKAMKLSKLPKALSLSNLLPKWTPNADSWKPGDPLPEGLVPNNPQPAPRFPIGEQY